jgi:hypothetical protein
MLWVSRKDGESGGDKSKDSLGCDLWVTTVWVVGCEGKDSEVMILETSRVCLCMCREVRDTRERERKETESERERKRAIKKLTLMIQNKDIQDRWKANRLVAARTRGTLGWLEGLLGEVASAVHVAVVWLDLAIFGTFLGFLEFRLLDLHALLLDLLHVLGNLAFQLLGGSARAEAEEAENTPVGVDPCRGWRRLERTNRLVGRDTHAVTQDPAFVDDPAADVESFDNVVANLGFGVGWVEHVVLPQAVLGKRRHIAFALAELVSLDNV